ncbi:MAG: hypothetical protein KO202_05845 [Methanobacteriaceae archaeon]|jgi:hypothetical protein|nr:hypothetical protein [Methanobacteriaceae archaeon]
MQLKFVTPFIKKRGILQKHRTRIYEKVEKQVFNIHDFNKTKIFVFIDNLLQSTDYNEEGNCFVDNDNDPILLHFFVDSVLAELNENPGSYLK